MCDAENGIESLSSSDDEDKLDTEVKAEAPAAGPMTHPSGTVHLLVLMLLYIHLYLSNTVTGFSCKNLTNSNYAVIFMNYSL